MQPKPGVGTLSSSAAGDCRGHARLGETLGVLGFELRIFRFPGPGVGFGVWVLGFLGSSVSG